MDSRPALHMTRTQQMTVRTLKEGERGTMYLVARHVPKGVAAKGISAETVKEYEPLGTYTGSWIGDRREGIGTATFKDGKQYSGSWRDGRQHGRGTLYVKRGAATVQQYVGEWAYGQPQGRGAYHFPNGESYVGEFLAGQRHGVGTMTYADGSTYEGEWSGDKRNGQGRLQLPNGDFYEGGWEDDEKHGAGRFVYATRRMVLSGEWVRGAAKCGEMERFGEGPAAEGGEEGRDRADGVAGGTGAAPLPELGLAQPFVVLREAVRDAHAGAAGGAPSPGSLRLGTGGSAAGGGGGRARGELSLAQLSLPRLGAHGMTVAPSPSRGGAGRDDVAGRSTIARLLSLGSTYSLEPSLLGSLSLSQDELLQLAAAFHSCDPDARGWIPADVSALHGVVGRLGIAADFADVAELLRKLQHTQMSESEAGEASGHDTITFRVFVREMAALRD